MSRVKRGITAIKRRRNVLSQVKGYRFGRSKKERQAREAIAHAGAYAFAHRKDKKADRRRLWQIKINASLREMNMSYSKFMGAMKKKGILLDRKVLADLAENHPTIFAKIVKSVS